MVKGWLHIDFDSVMANQISSRIYQALRKLGHGVFSFKEGMSLVQMLSIQIFLRIVINPFPTLGNAE
jgi:hypothetical protein